MNVLSHLNKSKVKDIHPPVQQKLLSRILTMMELKLLVELRIKVEKENIIIIFIIFHQKITLSPALHNNVLHVVCKSYNSG